MFGCVCLRRRPCQTPDLSHAQEFARHQEAEAKQKQLQREEWKRVAAADAERAQQRKEAEERAHRVERENLRRTLEAEAAHKDRGARRASRCRGRSGAKPARMSCDVMAAVGADDAQTVSAHTQSFLCDIPMSQ